MAAKPWTPEENQRIEQMINSGAKRRDILAAFPDRQPGSVDGKCDDIRARKRRANAGQVNRPEIPDSSPRLPDPAPEAGGPRLPEPVEEIYNPFVIDTPGMWGKISDLHIPFHDVPTIQDWIADCKRHDVKGILFNGDILDFFTISRHYREPSRMRLKDELDKGKQFFEYIRSVFPRCRIIYKAGNHDERLRRYLAERAPEIFDLEEIQLEYILKLQNLGVEWVDDGRVVMFGKLPVVHGHEYRGSGGVMPARWLYLRTGESSMTSHFHHPSFYPFTTITNREIGCWSLGCACFLYPRWLRKNQWRHGWAMSELYQDQKYRVQLRIRLKSGQIV